MFSPANQPQFTLDIPGLSHDLQVLAFRGSEALNTPFAFEIECVSERPDLDLESLLNQPAFLEFAREGVGIHGVIDQVVQGESGHRLTRYHLLLVPRLDYLRHRYNHRIFQHLTVPEIIATILEEHGILADAYCFQFGPTVYPKRDYCVQYGESDLDVIQRFCEEEGIHFHFQHNPDGHLLVFGDDQTVFPRLGQPTPYMQDNSLVADEPVIKRFAMRLATRTNKVARRDYNFERPQIRMEAGALCEFAPELEDYHYPGRFDDRTRGKFLSRRELERHRADYEQAEGSSDQPTLRSGHLLELSDHPRPQWNDLWLLREVRHEGRQPQVLEESGTYEADVADGLQQGYRNTFVVTPADVVYRPALLHPKPRLLATQTAVVTGPEGEEIYCDEYGRIKVQFFWDREGQVDGKTSCWLRVASNWAGERYGAVAIPRVGMEVLVSFLEGDPDQPLVTGCLYHAANVVPYELPTHKTRSVFKTQSSPGGGGFNELRIEDHKGAEQIYIHAQRDWEQDIRHDQKIRVGHERHERIEANSYSELLAEEQRTIHADRKIELKSSDHLTVGNTSHTRAGKAVLVHAGQQVHIQAGAHVILNAGASLTLKGGGQHIIIGPGGILSSTPINLGGSPTAGMQAAPARPGLVETVEQGIAGGLLLPAQRNALLQKKPLCLICEAAKQEAAHA